MFKTAATKIAHNSTLPSLAGNKDLRPLQDLITAEKAVLVTLQKLSVDFNKASEALRTWGAGEGEDLGDTLSASTTILAHFSTALSQYASREHAVRDEMKNVRSREEALDELKRRRKSLHTKADSAEKKLNKMNPENKNLASQTDILNRLKDEIRVMDTEIMAEEARLGDFKRQSTRAFMTLKFGGLLECCEKGSIAAEYGKLVISEIPVDLTQPGLPRSMYGGHAKTEELMSDAQRRVLEVAFSSQPSSEEPSRFQPSTDEPPRFQPQPSEQYLGSAEPVSAQMSPGTRIWESGSTQSPNYLGTPQGLGRDNLLGGPPSPAYSPGETGGYLHQPRPQQPPAQFPRHSVDDFGVNNPSASGTTAHASAGGKFSTFPAKSNRPSGGGFALHDNPVPARGSDNHEQTFFSSVTDALSTRNLSSEPKTAASHDSSTPAYDQPSSAPPPRLSSGTDLGNPWSESGSVTSIGSPHNRLSTISDTEPQLAYMAEPSEEMEEPMGRNDSDANLHGDDRHVRFGRVTDVDEEMRGRASSSNRDPPPKDTSPSHRVLPPSLDQNDERELNAAAAREVARELDALNFNPPSPSMALAAMPSSLSFAQPSDSDRTPSPLIPPAPLFAKRAVSPMPPPHTEVPQYQQSSSHVPSPQVHSLSPKMDSFFPSSPGVTPQGVPSSSNNSPYQTPPEYPRGSSSPFVPPTNLSSSSLSGQMMPSTRTISASAFRRPQPRLASLDAHGGIGIGIVADTSPLAFKKRLPSSPYPQRSSALPSPVTPVDSASQGPPAASRQPPVPRNSHLEDDDQFDYISAYVNSIGSTEEEAVGDRGHVANVAGVSRV